MLVIVVFNNDNDDVIYMYICRYYLLATFL